VSELFPARSIAIEELSCTDDSRIREFNRWYDWHHIVELKKAHGIVDVYRYLDTQADFGELGSKFMAPEGRSARYLTLYRISSDDPWAVMQQVKDDEEKRRANGELPEYLQSHDITVWDLVACRQSIQPPVRQRTHLPDGMPEAILLVFGGIDPAKRQEHDDWWLYAHAHDLLETPGLTQCERYRNLDPNPAEDDAAVLNIYELDADDPAAVFARILDDDVNVRRPQGRFSPFSRPSKAHASGLYRHWDLMLGRWP
jgi:hypothetical protein